MAELSKLQLEVDARSAIAAAEALERLTRASVKAEKHSKIKVGVASDTQAEVKATKKLKTAKVDLYALDEKRLSTINKLSLLISDANNGEASSVGKLKAAKTELESFSASSDAKQIRRSIARGNAVAQEAASTARAKALIVQGEERVAIAQINSSARLNEIERMRDATSKKNIGAIEAYRSAIVALRGLSATSTLEQIQHANDLANANVRLAESLTKVNSFSLGSIIQKGGFFGSLVGAASTFYIVSRAAETFFGIIKGAIGPSFEAAMAFDEMSRSYSALAGSFEKGQQLSNWIRGTAQTSIVATEAYSAAAKQLLGFGFSAEETQSILPRLADAAQGNSENFAHLALVYGQVRAQGRAMQQDMYQFVNAGIPIMEEVAKVLGKSTSEIRALVREGQIDLPVFEQAIINMTSQGGRFYEYNKKMAESATGAIKLLKNEWKEFLALSGEKGTGLVSWVTGAASDLVNNAIATLRLERLGKGQAKQEELNALPISVLQQMLRVSESNIGYLTKEQRKMLENALGRANLTAQPGVSTTGKWQEINANAPKAYTQLAQQLSELGAKVPQYAEFKMEEGAYFKQSYGEVMGKMLLTAISAKNAAKYFESADAEKTALSSAIVTFVNKAIEESGGELSKNDAWASVLLGAIPDTPEERLRNLRQDEFDRLVKVFDENAADKLSETPLALTATEINDRAHRDYAEKLQQAEFDRLVKAFDENAADKLSETPLALTATELVEQGHRENISTLQQTEFDRLVKVFDENAADKLSETPLALTAEEIEEKAHRAYAEKLQQAEFDRLVKVFDENAADKLSETPLALTAEEIDAKEHEARVKELQQTEFDRLVKIFDENAADKLSETPLALPSIGRLGSNRNLYGYSGLGNISLTTRPMVQNPNGSISTVRSMSENIGGKNVLLPTIGPNGENWSYEQAMEHYFATGENLGTFNKQRTSDMYAENLHEMQAALLEIAQSGLPSVERQLQEADIVAKFSEGAAAILAYDKALGDLKSTKEGLAQTWATSSFVASFETIGEAIATGTFDTENWKNSMIDALDALSANLSQLFLMMAFSAAKAGDYYGAVGWLALAGVSGIASGLLDSGRVPTYEATEGDPYSNFGNEGSRTIQAVASRAASTNVSFQIVDQTSKSVTIDRQTTTNADGTKILKAIVRDVVSTEMANGSFDTPMRSRYGVATSGRRRM